MKLADDKIYLMTYKKEQEKTEFMILVGIFNVDRNCDYTPTYAGYASLFFLPL